MALPTPKIGTGLMTIAFDLDGTLAEAMWPSPALGEPITAGVEAAIEYRRRGYECIVFTSRPADHAASIRMWLVQHGLGDTFYTIITDKPRYALFLDDRAAMFPECLGDD